MKVWRNAAHVFCRAWLQSSIIETLQAPAGFLCLILTFLDQFPRPQFSCLQAHVSDLVTQINPELITETD